MTDRLLLRISFSLMLLVLEQFIQVIVIKCTILRKIW